MTYASVRYEPSLHDASTFSCGEPTLDSWLLMDAVSESQRGSARVWVWLDDSDGVVGYYSLSASKVRRDAIPAALGRGGPQEVPAVLIGRLARDVSLRGKEFGQSLVADALSRIVQATLTVGARFVVVDALHERAAQFYERLGFRRLPDSLLLVQKIADVRAAFDMAQNA